MLISKRQLEAVIFVLRSIESQAVGWEYFDRSDTKARFISLKCIR